MTHNTDPIKTIETILEEYRNNFMELYHLRMGGTISTDHYDTSLTRLDSVATQAINNELLRARQELFDLYGTPVCDNLHHIKKHQHRASEECPVVKRLTQLKQSQTEGGE